MARVKKEAEAQEAAEKQSNELTLSRMEQTIEEPREPVVRKEGDFVITTY